MNYRQSQLLAAKTITTAGTEVLEVNVRDPISRLTAIVRLTNGSWTATGHPALVIKNLELVDGADVLFGMRGVYAQANSFYQTRKQPFNYCNFTDNGLAVAACPIDFGRRLYDPELALMPDRFNNLQLKIQHDYLLGGAVPDGATLEVWADLFDEKSISPAGFITSKSIWTKTLVASTTDYVELPTDYPIRMVLPAVFSNSEEPNINIDNIKITEDHDKRVVIEADVLSLLQMFESMYPQIHDHVEGRCTGGTSTYVFLTVCKDILLGITVAEDTDTYANWVWSGGNKQQLELAATATYVLPVSGRCPHGVFPIPMGDPDVIEDWWNTPALGSARIKMVTGGGDTSAYYELLLQQLRSY